MVNCVKVMNKSINPYHATGAYMHSQTDCSITPKWHRRLTVMLTVERFLLLKVADTINGELYCEHNLLCSS